MHLEQPGRAEIEKEQVEAGRAEAVLAEARAMPPNDPRRAAASIAMFDRLSEHWSLRGDERETLLGGVSKSTWSEWKQRPLSARVKADTRERIANLFTIDLNTHALFAAEFADRWVREPNVAFDGESPMSTMLRGKVEDIITVRRYLERIRTSSPSEHMRSDIIGVAHDVLVSYFPGDAVESTKKHSGLRRLRGVLSEYERLGLQGRRKYRPSPGVLATSLAEKGDKASVTALQRAVEAGRQASTTHYHRIDHITFAVSDVEAAIKFFGDVVGFQLMRRLETRGARTGMISAEMEHNGIKFVFCQGTVPESQFSQLITHYGPGVAHVALAVDDVAETVAQLKESGLRFATPVIQGPGVKQAVSSRDNNSGLSFEFIQRDGEGGFLDSNVSDLFAQLESSGSF